MRTLSVAPHHVPPGGTVVPQHGVADHSGSLVAHLADLTGFGFIQRRVNQTNATVDELGMSGDLEGNQMKG